MSITLKDLTKGEVAGSGVFDELMRTVNSHIEKQFAEGRLVGSDFGNAYVASIQASLQQATQFTLQAPIQTQQELILQQNLENARKQEALLDAQIAGQLIQNQINQYQLDQLMPLQKSNAELQNQMLTEQNRTQVQQTELVTQNTNQVLAQISMTGKQEDLVDEQIIAAKDQYTNPTGGLNKANYDNIQANIAIAEQKLLTEKAQISDDPYGTGTPVKGLVGSEIALKEEQKSSFERDAEQKAAKFYADVFSIIFSTNPSSTYSDPAAWGLGQTDSALVLDKLRAGIGV